MDVSPTARERAMKVKEDTGLYFSRFVCGMGSVLSSGKINVQGSAAEDQS